MPHRSRWWPTPTGGSIRSALPKKLSAIHPPFGIPSYATLVSGIGTAIFVQLVIDTTDPEYGSGG